MVEKVVGTRNRNFVRVDFRDREPRIIDSICMYFHTKRGIFISGDSEHCHELFEEPSSECLYAADFVELKPDVDWVAAFRYESF